MKMSNTSGRKQNVDGQNGMKEQKHQLHRQHSILIYMQILLLKGIKRIGFEKHCTQNNASNNNLQSFNEKENLCLWVCNLCSFILGHSNSTWFNAYNMAITAHGKATVLQSNQI